MFDLNGIRTLIVDVDGTLSPVDTLRILRIRWCLRHPFRIRELRHWRGTSKQEEKVKLWCEVGFQCSIPMNQYVLSVVEFARSRGITVVVASGSAHELAAVMGAQIAADYAFGSSVSTNLTRETKASFLQERFDLTSAAYIGDSSADCPVWAQCAKGFIVRGRVLRSKRVECTRDLIVISSEGLLVKFRAFAKLILSPLLVSP